VKEMRDRVAGDRIDERGRTQQDEQQRGDERQPAWITQSTSRRMGAARRATMRLRTGIARSGVGGYG